MNHMVYLLCAGLGTRLKERTKNCPKPMLEIQGRPLLEYTIRHLKNCGIQEILINTHYLGNMIQEYFQDGKKFGVHIQYLHEDSPSGSAGALIKAEKIIKKMNPSSFLVLYGDVITNHPFEALIKEHEESNSKRVATIITHKRKNSNSIVCVDEKIKQVRKLLERPSEEEKLPYKDQETRVNSGLYCFSQEIFSYLPDLKAQEICDFPRDIFPKIINDGKLYIQDHQGKRIAVDDEERYQLACNTIKEIFP